MKKRKELKRDKVAGTPAGIRESLKKATTEMLVLFLLERKPMYTYEMMQTIKLMSDGKISLEVFCMLGLCGLHTLHKSVLTAWMVPKRSA